MNWTVVYVRPRCEKKMAGYCSFCNIVHYLPLRNETKIYQRRKVTVQKPLFPGYVFVEISQPQREIVLTSCNVVRFIEVDNQTRFLWELEQVKKALTVDPTLGATSAIAKGRSVRIISGPFSGIEGVVDSQRGQNLVVLNVQMIGKGVAVVVDMDMLEAMDN